MKAKWQDHEIVVAFLGLLIAAFLAIMMCSSANGATVKAKFFHDSDNGDSARFIVFSNTSGDSIAGGTMSEATDGDGARWTGTATVTELGPLTIWGYVKEGTEPFFVGYGTDLSPTVAVDTLQNQDDWITAKMDSIMLMAGDRTGAFSSQNLHTDRDTLWFGIGNDTLYYRVYYHIGGGEGAVPDSTRTFAF